MSECNLKTLKMEGQLYKYTNVVRGFQVRYFIVNNETSKLDYYMSEDMKAQRPRGSIDLQNAVINPSEEDSTTFSIHTPENEIVKLRAQDAKERQHWVNILRLVSEKANENAKLNNQQMNDNLISSKKVDDASLCLSVSSNNFASKPSLHDNNSNSNSLAVLSNRLDSMNINTTNRAAMNRDNYELIKEVYSHVKASQQKLEYLINDLPKRGSKVNRYDKDLLILKASARSCVSSIAECCQILKSNQRRTLN